MIDAWLNLDLMAVALAALTCAVLLESAAPLRPANALGTRWLHNGSLALITYLTSYFLITAVAVWCLDHARRSVGDASINLSLNDSLWTQCVAVFFAQEFFRYGIHWLSHKVPLLWRFHAVHHADPEVDAATAFRHHPFEGLVGVIPITLLTFLLGAAPEVLIWYRAADLLMTVFTHLNTRIPKNLESAIGYILVTPRFHRTHHFSEHLYTDSNYGAITPWFDWLFGTYRRVSDSQNCSADLGLGWQPEASERLNRLLLAPFVKAPESKP